MLIEFFSKILSTISNFSQGNSHTDPEPFILIEDINKPLSPKENSIISIPISDQMFWEIDDKSSNADKQAKKKLAKIKIPKAMKLKNNIRDKGHLNQPQKIHIRQKYTACQKI